MKSIVPLNTGWRLRFCDWREGARMGYPTADTHSGWMPASVPGDVHLDCLREGLIPDPYFGANIDRCVWMEDKDWWYRLDFSAPPVAPHQRLFLHFEGLDTFATVFLNGQQIAAHANMFTPLRSDVTDAVVSGVNKLAVCLASPRYSVRTDAPPTVAGNPPIERLLTRKAQACYGWDIAPRLVTCGIWRPVSLICAGPLEIERVAIRTLCATQACAELEISAVIRKHAEPPAPPCLTLTCADQTISIPFDAVEPVTTIVHTLNIPSPLLWWPHDHGTPHLYEYTITLSAGGHCLDTAAGRCGIRTVRLVQNPLPQGGRSFRFDVNGKPIFLKGMNWTPPDAIYARIDAQRYHTLLHAAKNANINALRVWGGGIYEHDEFYRLCDELGILLWQDFMFACGCYPQDDAFLAHVRAEAEYVVGRLRSHPCLLALCGDNECDWLAPQYGVPQYPTFPLTKRLLPSVVESIAPDIPYIPSSPFSTICADQNADDDGDVHLWAHGQSFASPFYLARAPKMVSEIGHIAMPDIEVIRAFVPAEEAWPIFNDVWRLHSADPRRVCWNRRLQSMFASIRAQGWDEPRSLPDLIRLTQQLQADATRAWIRHFASCHACWGIFLWNLADCWPQVSDAYIAYPFHPKPALAVVREEFQHIHRS